MDDLKERLLAKEPANYGDGYLGPTRLNNPDGPEALARIEKLEAALEQLRGSEYYWMLSQSARLTKMNEIIVEALQSGEARGI